MTQKDLLDAIGGVDDDLLAQSDEVLPIRRSIPRRIWVIAALIAIFGILVGAIYVTSVPVDGIRLVSQGDGTDAYMDENGRVSIDGPQERVTIHMDFPVNDDTTWAIRQGYLPQVPEDWDTIWCGWSMTALNGFPDTLDQFWLRWESQDLDADEFIYYRQTTAYYHSMLRDTFDGYVDSMRELYEGMTVTAKQETLGNFNILRVTVSEVPESALESATIQYSPPLYMPNGEVRVYWADGDHFFLLRCPESFSDEQILALMESLEPIEGDLKTHLEEIQDATPEKRGE